MSILDWPEAERPRERLLAHGAASLSDGELLAIFLRTGVAGHTAVDVARNLLIRFGSLRALLEADVETFSQHFGMGPAKYAQLQASVEMNRRYMAELMRTGQAMEDPNSVRRYLKSKLRHEKHELFGCLFLDTKHKPLEFEILFRGTISSVAVYPREVVKRAIANNAAAVILTHNHPSGNATPSEADRRLTQRLTESLALVDVRVLDHIIIGEGEPLSMMEYGWM
ncbi:RadC family protein [Pseudomonas sp. UBA4194]|jgi:DNA repair protein RadC|uniref:RadC family protein n=1 Tax=Pseudomonas sp. UBA4194 TaxID=1947317 RepID=UPI0025E1D55B|nr:DNA repair protein RadC [Pseudomonas sp. UBA4194]